MEFRIMKYFLEVANTGNITKAANNLHITQPTLSRQLNDLEEELGVNLFIRGKRQITLTDQGILYYQRANEMMKLYDKTIRELNDDRNQLAGSISIGCVETIAAYLLAETIKREPP